jgi:hypothetical protein
MPPGHSLVLGARGGDRTRTARRPERFKPSWFASRSLYCSPMQSPDLHLPQRESKPTQDRLTALLVPLLVFWEHVRRLPRAWGGGLDPP